MRTLKYSTSFNDISAKKRSPKFEKGILMGKSGSLDGLVRLKKKKLFHDVI